MIQNTLCNLFRYLVNNLGFFQSAALVILTFTYTYIHTHVHIYLDCNNNCNL